MYICAAQHFTAATVIQTIKVRTSQWPCLSVHGSLHAVFRVGKPQYDLLRFDFQVGVWRDRRLPDRRCRCRSRRLPLLPVLREPAPGEQPDGAERSSGDVQLPLRSCGSSEPELRQLLLLQHRAILHLLHSGGHTYSALSGAQEVGRGAQADRSARFCSINVSTGANTSTAVIPLIQHVVVSCLSCLKAT